MKTKTLLLLFLFIGSGYFSFSQLSVKGSVKNDKAEPLIGATVLVENKSGFKKATQSGNDGLFVIAAVPQGDDYVFTVSYVGYASRVIEAVSVTEGGELNFDISLEPTRSTGDEIVVVAYSTQKKANLTGAVDQVSGKVLENRSISNLSQGLQGFIPNLNLVMGDGKPTQSPAYNIRGNTSIGQGGSALVLIDGVEGDPSLLNPNDVANITVLKDASSAAIYGARGAFGVVLITTKNPVKGKTSINYSTNYSIKSPIVVPDYVTNGYEFARIFNDAWSAWNDYSQFPQNVNKTVRFSQDYLAELKRRNEDPSLPKVEVNANGEYVYYENTDWYGLLYKDNTKAMDHNLSISGSNEKASYMVTARYYGQNGLFRYNTDDYKMYNIRAKGSIQALPWLRIENNMDYSNMLYHNPLNVGEGGGIWRNIADEGHEMSPLFNPDGNLSYSAAYTVGDFVYGKNGIDFDKRILRNRTAFTTEFFNNTLRLKGDFTIQNLDNNSKTIRVAVPYSRKPGVIEYVGTTTNDIAENYTETQYLATNLYAEYENTIKQQHYFKALAGFNYEQSTYKGLNTQRNGLIYENVESINLALGTAITTAGPYEQWNIKGGFFRLNYSFDERYLLEVNGRYDGSSKFPSNKRYAFFPSVSAGWRVAKEHFWNVPKNSISDLKIRASYGSLGNGNIASYAFIEQFGISQSGRVLGGIRPQTTSQPSVLPDNLTWEEATTTDVGVDIAFLNNRLQVNADWYIRNTKDMFTTGPTLPAVFGTSVPKGNYADLRTKGWEVVAAWRDNGKLAGKPFGYGIRLSLADYQSEITRYNNPTKLLNDYYVGQKLGEIWGYVTDGFFTNENIGQAAQQSQIKSSNSGTTLIGDIKFLDLNKDGTINTGANTVADPGDRKIIGNSQQRYTFGALFDFDWNNFFISAFFQGVGKQDWWPGAEADAFWGPYNRPYNRVPAEMVNEIWSESNPNTYFPRLRGYIAQGTGRSLNVTQTKYLQNVAYVRLKNLQLGYSLPKTLISRLKLSQVKAYISVDNIWTYSPMYKITHNLDVENIQGSDRVLTNGGNGNGNNYPMLKGWTVGINIGL
ncbi:SusC/RagA family TonB-linked outer membrane protein [Terrimonas pollutisoli]|uniref:SusC/RagA family TonB-linked outer membrane protein n=1 Tax=Terrimonas pollutisoli TaxID=3034147 RepID=UPI0023EDC84C|nr:SusC/RagA family TonB-linked outer membrane protein [Terrimonas sp. H1YJ31]